MLSGANKFLIENYALKRNISKSAMSTRMTKFKTLNSKRPDTGISAQTLAVFEQYSGMEIKELQKIVISILKHEYQAKALNIQATEQKRPINPVKPKIATKTAINKIIRREKKEPSSE